MLTDIERAKHGGLGGAIALAMVHRIDQHGNPEHIRQQDEFLPARGAFLPGAGQKLDRVTPLVEGEIGLADEIVQRLNQFFHQEFNARVRRLLKAADDGSGQFGVVELGHCYCPAGYAVAGGTLYQQYDRVKHAAIGTQYTFRYLDIPRQLWR